MARYRPPCAKMQGTHKASEISVKLAFVAKDKRNNVEWTGQYNVCDGVCLPGGNCIGSRRLCQHQAHTPRPIGSDRARVDRGLRLRRQH
eukprot:scaffold118485_cov78-Phaeocystis_antarctica.AAC.1